MINTTRTHDWGITMHIHSAWIHIWKHFKPKRRNCQQKHTKHWTRNQPHVIPICTFTSRQVRHPFTNTDAPPAHAEKVVGNRADDAGGGGGICFSEKGILLLPHIYRVQRSCHRCNWVFLVCSRSLEPGKCSQLRLLLKLPVLTIDNKGNENKKFKDIPMSSGDIGTLLLLNSAIRHGFTRIQALFSIEHLRRIFSYPRRFETLIRRFPLGVAYTKSFLSRMRQMNSQQQMWPPRCRRSSYPKRILLTWNI